MQKPESLVKAEEELIKICNAYPVCIPLEVVAKFIGMDDNCLRESIDQGKCRFGIGGKNGPRGVRFSKIPTVVFYNWITMGQSLN